MGVHAVHVPGARIRELGKLPRVLRLRRKEDERNLGGSHETNWTCCCTAAEEARPATCANAGDAGDAKCLVGCLADGTLLGDAEERRHWEESVTWRCDDEWETPISSGQGAILGTMLSCNMLGTTIYATSWRCVVQALQFVGRVALLEEGARKIMAMLSLKPPEPPTESNVLVLPYLCDRRVKNPSIWKESACWSILRLCFARG